MNPYTLSAFTKILEPLPPPKDDPENRTFNADVAEGNIIGLVVDYARKLEKEIQEPDTDWQIFASFWPPRFVEALATNDSTIFFGAGLSMSAGLPSWSRLLSENFGLRESLLTFGASLQRKISDAHLHRIGIRIEIMVQLEQNVEHGSHTSQTSGHIVSQPMVQAFQIADNSYH